MVLTVMRMQTYLYYTPRFFPREHTLNVDLCPTRVQRSYDIVEVAGSRSHAFSHGEALWLHNALTTNELVVIIRAAVSPREEPGPSLEPPGG